MSGPKLYPLGSHIPKVRNNNGHKTSPHQATCQRSNFKPPAWQEPAKDSKA